MARTKENAPLMKMLTNVFIFLGGMLLGKFPGAVDTGSIYIESTFIDSSPLETNRMQHPRYDDPHRMHWTIPEDIALSRKAECNNMTVSSTGGYCIYSRGKHTGLFDTSLAKFLAEKIFYRSTVVDLGAGLGHYGKLFQNTSIKKWTGYDGAINIKEATDGYVRFMDLTQPHASDERPCVGADWVLSLEVAEHIPSQYQEAFLRNIRCHAKLGAVVSWALPGQTGIGHVNEKPEEEQHAAMKRWGFQVDQVMTKEIRGVAQLSYFRRTVTVYRL